MIGLNADRHEFNYDHPMVKLMSFWSHQVSGRNINEPQHEISNNVVCATSKSSDQPVHTPSLIRAFASGLNIL